jgi:methyl-accepting chemotaxis protein
VNEVKIVVSGTNKFGGTQQALTKQLKGIEDAAGGVAKRAADLEAAWDRAAAKMSAQLDGVTATARGYKDLASALSAAGKEFDQFGDDAEKSTKKASQGIGDGVSDAVEDMAEKAASGFLSAGVNAARSLVGGISEGVSRSGPYVQGAMVAAGVTAAAAAGPLIGGALAGGVVTAFGAGIAGVGIAAAAQSSRVQAAYDNAWQRITDSAENAARPLEQVLVNFAGRAETILGESGLGAAVRNSIAEMAPGLDRFGDSLLRSFAKLEPAIAPMTRAFGRVIDDLGPTLERTLAGISDALSGVADSVARNPEALGDFVEMMGDVAEVGLDAVGVLNTMHEGNKRLVDIATTPFEWVGLKDAQEQAPAASRALDAVAESAWRAKSPADVLDGAWQKAAESAKRLAEAGSNVLETLDILSGRSPAFEESQQKIDDTIRRMVERFSDVTNHINGYGQALINANGTVNTATENGSALQDMLTDLQQGYSDSAAAIWQMQAAGMSQDEAVRTVSGSLAEQSNRLLDQHAKFRLTREEMQRLLDTYKLTPQWINTTVNLDTSAAQAKLAWLQRMASQVAGASLPFSSLPSGRSPDARAHGGISGGGWTRVGEFGEEMVKLPPGSQVMPHTASARQYEPGGLGTGSGGGGAVTVTLDLAAAGHATGLERVFIQWLKEAIRGRGGDASVLGGGS